MRFRTNLKTRPLVLTLLLFCAAGHSFAAGEVPTEESLRLGEAMYQKGLLPSGRPLTGVVQGDIEISGTMTTCANCHLRSGLGSLEGGVLTPPTNGARLFAPLLGQQDIPGDVMKKSMFRNPRPAYTEETLADAIRYGKSPSGRTLSETMPRYPLNEGDLKILVSYLKSLSSAISPGVTDDEIRFATIVTDKAGPREREALLQPLDAFIREEWNGRLPLLSRLPAGKFYRKIALDVWELKGKPESWGEQLADLYRKRPVFAVLGGIAPGKWDPVHDFCEKNRIPCILPFTDLPVVSGSDWYTLYFSKGYYQEGEAAAKYLSRVFDLPATKEIVQVFRDSDEGKALALGFTDTWKKLGNAPLADRMLQPGEKTGGSFWRDLSAAHPNAVFLVWLPPADTADIGSLAGVPGRPSTLFVSATMLGDAFSSLPEPLREFTFATYPARLPQETEYTRSIVAGWMKFKKVPTVDMAVSSRAYFLTRILSGALLEMGGDFYRDFFLDIVDGGKDQPTASLTYPVLTFGPGQRYASKGCYVVTLGQGKNPKVIRQSEWIIY